MAISRPIGWQPTIRTGPKQGVAVDAKIMKRIISEAGNAFIVAGPEIINDERLFRLATHLTKKNKIPVIATAHAVSKFNEKNIPAFSMSITQVADALRDENFRISGNKPDLAIFIGVKYGTANDVFSLVKNFSEIKTACISRYYQPNAGVSFPNLTEELFEDYLNVLEDKEVK